MREPVAGLKNFQHTFNFTEQMPALDVSIKPTMRTFTAKLQVCNFEKREKEGFKHKCNERLINQ